MAKPHCSPPLVELCNVDFTVQQRKLLEDVSLAVRTSEIWQIHGPAGTGKSILLELLLGRHRVSAGIRHYPAFVDESPDAAIGIPPRFALRLVSQEEQRRVASSQASFYQARWHSLWTEPLTIEVFLSRERVLGLRAYEVLDCLPVRRDYDEERERCLIEMNLSDRGQQLVGQLSNGELRKLLLIAAHLASPKLLLLDDPLGGLDPVSRECARKSILRWCNAGQTIVYCASYEDDLGPIATHHYRLDARTGMAAWPETASACGRDLSSNPEVTHARGAAISAQVLDSPARESPLRGESDQSEQLQRETGATRVPPTHVGISPTLGDRNATASRVNPVIRCSKVQVSAGPQLLLDAVDWEVLQGEHWMITGPNGAGKSTLLALMMGDHPQAYSNVVQVLGTQLGEGTTLWERRRAIGFVAPELSWHYPQEWSLFDVVLSGFDASIGSYREPSPEERVAADKWLHRLGLGEKASVPLALTSEGEKRLALLARAMVREPPLLLLDEPTQNVSDSARARLFAVLDGLADWTTIVLVTHHLEERPRCINRQLALERGRVRYRGPVGGLV